MDARRAAATAVGPAIGRDLRAELAEDRAARPRVALGGWPDLTVPEQARLAVPAAGPTGALVVTPHRGAPAPDGMQLVVAAPVGAALAVTGPIAARLGGAVPLEAHLVAMLPVGAEPVRAEPLVVAPAAKVRLAGELARRAEETVAPAAGVGRAVAAEPRVDIEVDGRRRARLVGGEVRVDPVMGEATP